MGCRFDGHDEARALLTVATNHCGCSGGALLGIPLSERQGRGALALLGSRGNARDRMPEEELRRQAELLGRVRIPGLYSWWIAEVWGRR
jgi:hypothetical protein